MRIAFCLVAIAISGALSANIEPNPLSDEFIDLINTKQSTWKAGRNFHENTPVSHLRRLLGALKYPGERSESKVLQHNEDTPIPESFDAREKWSNCQYIDVIRDQSACTSSWAVSTTSVMSDRICIHSNGTKQIYVSDEDLLTCCLDCGFRCLGGFSSLAWYYWQHTGIVSGGPRNSTTGCRAYSMDPCDHHSATGKRPSCSDLHFYSPQCVRQCDDNSSLEYYSDRTYGQQYYFMHSISAQIQQEILKNGPVQATFDVYTDFFSYKSGVYQQVSGEEEGSHSVKIVGWGVENDTAYWLVANSWNEDWGEKGYFKIIRGRNECNIESDVIAALPRFEE